MVFLLLVLAKHSSFACALQQCQHLCPCPSSVLSPPFPYKIKDKLKPCFLYLNFPVLNFSESIDSASRMLYLLTNQMTAVLPHRQDLCWVTWRRSSSEADKSGLESLPSVGTTWGTVVSKHCLASTNEWTFAKPHGYRWQERQWGNVSPWNGNLLYFVELLFFGPWPFCVWGTVFWEGLCGTLHRSSHRPGTVLLCPVCLCWRQMKQLTGDSSQLDPEWDRLTPQISLHRLNSELFIYL